MGLAHTLILHSACSVILSDSDLASSSGHLGGGHLAAAIRSARRGGGGSLSLRSKVKLGNAELCGLAPREAALESDLSILSLALARLVN